MTKNYIPTINISSLIKNNFDTINAFKTIKKIEKACVDIGFFQVIGHGLNLKEIKKTCDVGSKFFNLSDIKKRKLSPKKWNKKNRNIYSNKTVRMKEKLLEKSKNNPKIIKP